MDLESLCERDPKRCTGFEMNLLFDQQSNVYASLIGLIPFVAHPALSGMSRLGKNALLKTKTKRSSPSPAPSCSFPLPQGEGRVREETIFHGIEDWKLYEEGLGLYLEASQKQGRILEKLQAASRRLQIEKEKVYSKELLELDRLLQDFRKNATDLITVLQKLAQIKKPEAGSELDLLLEESKKESSSQRAIEVEVTRIAEQVKELLQKRGQAQKQKSVPVPFSAADLINFNQKYQEFQTSRISPQAFALCLKEFLEKIADSVERTADRETLNAIRSMLNANPDLSRLIRNQKRMQDIQGTKLFEDLEQYAQEVKDSMMKKDEERALDRQSHNLYLLEKLAKLELSREEWSELQSFVGSTSYLEKNLWASYLGFYRNAELRDSAFFNNLVQLSTKYDVRNTLLVAGGFHTEGLAQRFKEKGISYMVVTPHMDFVPDESNYRAHMRGDVSWKDYFEAENGRVNLYKAFVRGARDQLLRGQETRGRGQELSFPVSPVSRPLLKAWRDQIIRDLTAQNQITRAHAYTQFLDEVSGKNLEDQWRSKWLANIDRFMDSLKQLETKGQLNEPNVLKLLSAGGGSALGGKPATTISAAAGTAIGTPDAWVAKAILQPEAGSLQPDSRAGVRANDSNKLEQVQKFFESQSGSANQSPKGSEFENSVIGNRKDGAYAFFLKDNVGAPLANTPASFLKGFYDFWTRKIRWEFTHSEGQKGLSRDVEQPAFFVPPFFVLGTVIQNLKTVTNSHFNIAPRFRKGFSLAYTAWKGWAFGNVSAGFIWINHNSKLHLSNNIRPSLRSQDFSRSEASALARRMGTKPGTRQRARAEVRNVDQSKAIALIRSVQELVMSNSFNADSERVIEAIEGGDFREANELFIELIKNIAKRSERYQPLQYLEQAFRLLTGFPLNLPELAEFKRNYNPHADLEDIVDELLWSSSFPYAVQKKKEEGKGTTLVYLNGLSSLDFIGISFSYEIGHFDIKMKVWYGTRKPTAETKIFIDDRDRTVKTIRDYLKELTRISDPTQVFEASIPGILNSISRSEMRMTQESRSFSVQIAHELHAKGIIAIDLINYAAGEREGKAKLITEVFDNHSINIPLPDEMGQIDAIDQHFVPEVLKALAEMEEDSGIPVPFEPGELYAEGKFPDASEFYAQNPSPQNRISPEFRKKYWRLTSERFIEKFTLDYYHQLRKADNHITSALYFARQANPQGMNRQLGAAQKIYEGLMGTAFDLDANYGLLMVRELKKILPLRIIDDYEKLLIEGRIDSLFHFSLVPEAIYFLGSMLFSTEIKDRKAAFELIQRFGIQNFERNHLTTLRRMSVYWLVGEGWKEASNEISEDGRNDILHLLQLKMPQSRSEVRSSFAKASEDGNRLPEVLRSSAPQGQSVVERSEVRALPITDVKKVIASFLEQLMSKDPEVRSKGASGLGGWIIESARAKPIAGITYFGFQHYSGLPLSVEKVQQIVQALSQALKDGNSRVRSGALYSFYQIAIASQAPPSVLPDLMPLLRDPEDEIRAEAINVIKEIGPPNVEDWVLKLREALKDPYAVVRKSAALALLKVPPQQAAVALPELMTTLKDALTVKLTGVAHYGGLPELIVDTFRRIGPAAYDVLAITLQSETNAKNRGIAARTLGDIGLEAASQAIPVLRNALSDSDMLVRGISARSLGEMGQAAAEQAGAQLVKLLLDPEELVRFRAVEALMKLNVSDVAIRRAIEDLSKNAEADFIRRTSAELLKKNRAEVRSEDEGKNKKLTSWEKAAISIPFVFFALAMTLGILENQMQKRGAKKAQSQALSQETKSKAVSESAQSKAEFNPNEHKFTFIFSSKSKLLEYQIRFVNEMKLSRMIIGMGNVQGYIFYKEREEDQLRPMRLEEFEENVKLFQSFLSADANKKKEYPGLSFGANALKELEAAAESPYDQIKEQIKARYTEWQKDSPQKSESRSEVRSSEKKFIREGTRANFKELLETTFKDHYGEGKVPPKQTAKMGNHSRRIHEHIQSRPQISAGELESFVKKILSNPDLAKALIVKIQEKFEFGQKVVSFSSGASAGSGLAQAMPKAEVGTSKSPLPPLLEKKYVINSTLPSMKKTVQDTIDWLIEQGYPHPNVLRNYQNAVNHAEEMSSAEANQGILFRKTVAAETAAQLSFEELWKNKKNIVKINTRDLYPILAIIRILGSSEYFLENFASILVREAWGLETLQWSRPEQEELSRSAMTIFVNERQRLLGDAFSWPGEALSQFLAQYEQQIVRLAALSISFEYYEAMRHVEMLNWAKRKGLYSSERIEELLSKKTEQYVSALRALRKRALRLLAAGDQSTKLLETELQHLAANRFPLFLQGTGDLSANSIGFYFLLEFERFIKSQGKEGIDPDILDRVQTGFAPPQEMFRSSAEYLSVPIEQIITNWQSHSIRSEVRSHESIKWFLNKLELKDIDINTPKLKEIIGIIKSPYEISVNIGSPFRNDRLAYALKIWAIKEPHIVNQIVNILADSYYALGLTSFDRNLPILRAEVDQLARKAAQKNAIAAKSDDAVESQDAKVYEPIIKNLRTILSFNLRQESEREKAFQALSQIASDEQNSKILIPSHLRKEIDKIMRQPIFYELANILQGMEKWTIKGLSNFLVLGKEDILRKLAYTTQGSLRKHLDYEYAERLVREKVLARTPEFYDSPRRPYIFDSETFKKVTTDLQGDVTIHLQTNVSEEPFAVQLDEIRDALLKAVIPHEIAISMESAGRPELSPIVTFLPINPEYGKRISVELNAASIKFIDQLRTQILSARSEVRVKDSEELRVKSEELDNSQLITQDSKLSFNRAEVRENQERAERIFRNTLDRILGDWTVNDFRKGKVLEFLRDNSQKYYTAAGLISYINLTLKEIDALYSQFMQGHHVPKKRAARAKIIDQITRQLFKTQGIGWELPKIAVQIRFNEEGYYLGESQEEAFKIAIQNYYILQNPEILEEIDRKLLKPTQKNKKIKPSEELIALLAEEIADGKIEQDVFKLTERLQKLLGKSAEGLDLSPVASLALARSEMRPFMAGNSIRMTSLSDRTSVSSETSLSLTSSISSRSGRTTSDTVRNSPLSSSTNVATSRAVNLSSFISSFPSRDRNRFGNGTISQKVEPVNININKYKYSERTYNSHIPTGLRAITLAALALAPEAGRTILAKIDSDSIRQIVDKYRTNKQELRSQLREQVDSVKFTAQLTVMNNLDAQMTELKEPSFAIAAVIPKEREGDQEAIGYFLEGYFDGIDRSVGEMLIDGRIPDAYQKKLSDEVTLRSDLNVTRPTVLKSEQASVPVAMFAEPAGNAKIHSMFTPVFINDMAKLINKLSKDPDAPQKLRWLGKLASRTEIHLADLSQVTRLKKDPNALKAELLRRLDLEGYDLISISQNSGRPELRINAIQAELAFSDLVRRTIEAAA